MELFAVGTVTMILDETCGIRVKKNAQGFSEICSVFECDCEVQDSGVGVEENFWFVGAACRGLYRVEFLVCSRKRYVASFSQRQGLLQLSKIEDRGR